MAFNAHDFIGPNPMLAKALATDKAFAQTGEIADFVRIGCERDRKSSMACLWECGGSTGNAGAAICIGDMQAAKVKPIVCRRSLPTTRPNGNHALIPLSDRSIVMVAGHYANRSFIRVYQVAGFEMEKEVPFVQLRLVRVYHDSVGGVSNGHITLPELVGKMDIGLPDEFFNSDSYNEMLETVLVKAYTMQSTRPMYCLKWEYVPQWSLDKFKNKEVADLIASSGLGEIPNGATVYDNWDAYMSYAEDMASYIRVVHNPKEIRVSVQLLLMFTKELANPIEPNAVIESVDDGTDTESILEERTDTEVVNTDDSEVVDTSYAPDIPVEQTMENVAAEPVEQEMNDPVIRATMILVKCLPDTESVLNVSCFRMSKDHCGIWSPTTGKTVNWESIISHLNADDDQHLIPTRYKGD